MVQGLTSSDPYEQAGLLQVLLRMQCGNGLMHESIHVGGGYTSDVLLVYCDWGQLLGSFDAGHHGTGTYQQPLI
jgi:hypothetical protein